MRLEVRVAFGLGLFALFLAAAIFGFAGTVDYWQGWAYLAVFLGCSAAITAYLLRHDRALLERRMRGGPVAEERAVQRVIMWFASIGFLALVGIPGLDVRRGWSGAVSPWSVACGLALVGIAFYLIYRVYRVNSFTAATIQVEEGQPVISTGPYGVVRHPMYSGGVMMFVGTPLALGSYWGLIAAVGLTAVIVWRLVDEERFLAKSLRGYSDYRRRVRWRLVPGLY